MSVCASCATELPDNAKFCLECGRGNHRASLRCRVQAGHGVVRRCSPFDGHRRAVGTERLREIMADLLDRSTAIVTRYGGTVDKFTGDGIMAVFGAPMTLEDHAFRAAWLRPGHSEGSRSRRYSTTHRPELRPGDRGRNRLQRWSYTAIGQQVGMAQRMESVAPPGGVMLSESTARLVEGSAVLGDLELVQIKGSDEPVRARRLLAIGEHRPSRRTESALVGRSWELNTVTAILDEAIGGAGCVVTIVGPPGIGKSRLIREAAAIAAARGVRVFSTYCESHARDIPFHAVAQLLRAGMGIIDLDAAAARSRVHEQC